MPVEVLHTQRGEPLELWDPSDMTIMFCETTTVKGFGNVVNNFIWGEQNMERKTGQNVTKFNTSYITID